jgi:hypothetical protein
MSEDEPHGALDVLELTTVHYYPHDPFSVVFAYTTLTPLIILVSLATLLLFRRDLRTATLFGGLLINECLNYVLKKTFKQARPALLCMSLSYLLFFTANILSVYLSSAFSHTLTVGTPLSHFNHGYACTFYASGDRVPCVACVSFSVWINHCTNLLYLQL